MMATQGNTSEIRPNIAVIGSGYWGKNLVRNFAELGALAMICDTNPETRDALAAQYPGCRAVADFADVLRDDSIDAVSIATPAETHVTLVRKALLA